MAAKRKNGPVLHELLIFITVIGLCSCQDPPLIHNFPDYLTKSEGTPNGTVLFSFTATHPQNKDITIETVDAVTNNIVYVNQTYGGNIAVDVITKSELDRDGDGRGYPGSAQARLRFKATDTNGNEIFMEVTLYISDVNDNVPVLQNRPYTWEIPELPFNQSKTYSKVNATDYDSGNNGTSGIRYYMKPMTQSTSTADEYRATFGINSETGEVTLKKQLHYETNSYYQFNVTARDDNGNGNTGLPADLIIRVLDVQNRPPFFTGQPYRSTIQENVNLNTWIIRIIARDGDTGVSNLVNYTILPGKCSTLFNISKDGDISTAAVIDRDSGDVNAVGGVCVINVLVQEVDQYPDKQFGNTTATSEVTITIEDKNDNPPEFENITYIAEVQENTPQNVPITLLKPTEINVYDIDQGNNAKIDLSLHYPNGTECNDFSVSPTTIQKSGSALIRVSSQTLLDFEIIKDISFLIIANESSSSNHTTTATVSLHILDMNDNNPQFENSTYSFNIRENADNGTSVGVITATDVDSSIWGNITYSISGGNNRFNVDMYTGVIYTSCKNCPEEIDRETVDVYYMTYTATDHNGRGRSNSTSLVIHILDKNDNTPTFIRATYSAFIDENDAQYNSTAVIKVEAHDDDKEGTNNSMILYSILELSEKHLSTNIYIDNTTGKLHLHEPIDFEKLTTTSGIIKITVEARDLGVPSEASNATVIITVTDVNDNKPTFNKTVFVANVSENSTSNVTHSTSVGSVLASDNDRTLQNNKINYFIVSGAMDHFVMEPRTGEVSVQIGAKLDRETIANYSITIMVIDQGSPPLNSTALLQIDVDDVNDQNPVFNVSDYKVSVFENTTELVGRTFITCLATDPDINSKLEYNISIILATNEADGVVNSTLVQDYFRVHENNGSVYINTEPDRELAKTIVLKIQAMDKNAYEPTPQIVEVPLTITLLDINDNPPEFTAKLPYNVNVSENAQDPTILLTITATDRDENRTVKYEIIDISPESDSFDIHPVSGVLRKKRPLDREKNSSFTLQVNATDNGVPPFSSTAKVIITVLDFNDNAPEFVDFTKNTSIPENASVGYFVLRVNASDDDIGPNKNVTYSIEEGADGMFTIDPLSGIMTVSVLLDRETKPVYTLRIKAQDNPLELKEQKTVIDTLTIILEDINDNHPLFDKTYYSESVLENENINSAVIQISASDNDEDGTNNSRISFSFSNNTSPSDLFRIDKDSGIVYVNRSLVSNVGSYILGLVAEDHGDPKQTNKNSAVVNITVLDINLNNPYITNLPEDNKIVVYECVDVGHTIYQFNYKDDDIGINALADFNISEIDGSIFDTFEMESNGTLKVIKKLNALDLDAYRFQIQVTDRGTPALSSVKRTITVKVIDVNDHPPLFDQETIPFSVKENQATGEAVGTVSANDADQNSRACYSFKDNDTREIFDIGKYNGSIVTQVVLDYENITQYRFTVRVKDCSLVTYNSSECANVTHASDPREFINVTVNVIDANDHPPVFKVDEISVGMRRTTEINTTLDISLKTSDYIEDKDTDVNGKQAWVFTNGGDIQTSSSLSGINGILHGVTSCSDKKHHIVCITGNGSLINNKYYSEDISGYFIVPVNVSDTAGSDTVNVKIFLISDSQILVMTLLGSKEEIAEKKNEILKIYSEVTGYTFVYDWLEDHKTPDGRVETFKTDLYFHVVDRQTERALSASEAIRVVDSNYEKLLQAMQQFSVLQIVSSVKEAVEEDNLQRTIYILAAVIAALAVTVAIIVYVSITTRNTYKRKLRAATVKPRDINDVTEKDNGVIPGSNIYCRLANPLLHTEIPEEVEYDNISMGSHNSLDTNSVGEPREETGTFEEKEVRMDMYLEYDTCNSNTESPLDVALKQYDMQNHQNKQDNSSTEGIVSPHGMEAFEFENHAYVGEFETTEI